ncbi:helix-turn-helix domain-containing protein [Cohnella cellulosilytica]|uniref:Helix-turn-helix domain-containing protein n=1 Tax=Cohnella cellulosilytica TaxID=986710 RepID=A0ABW2F6G7_9BACL
MPLNERSAYLSELLRNLKVQPIDAYYTRCTSHWRELDYVPDYNKLYYICDGEGWVKIEDAEYYPKPGQIVFMPANVKQSYSVVSGNTYEKYWCHFTATIGELDLFQWFDVPHCMNVGQHKRWKTLFEELASLHADGAFLSRIREKAVLLELVALLLAEAGTEIRVLPGRSSDVQRLDLIERYIEEHLAEPVSLEQVARHVHLHPNYLVRYFNKQFGVSPLKYLNRRRMQKARELLSSTSLSVKEVAERVGYADTNHFAKAFRRENSCSPTEYRLRNS